MDKTIHARQRSFSFQKSKRNSVLTIIPPMNEIEEILKGDTILRGNKRSPLTIQTEQSEEIPRAVGRYILRATIGEGSNSVYKIATPSHEPTKKLACKIIDKKRLNSSTENLIKKEVSTLKNLENPFLVNLIDFLNDSNYYYLFYEYCPRSLLDNLLKIGPLPELNAARLFKQICQGVKYLHDQSISHRNLKLDNILISTEYLSYTKSGPSSPISTCPLTTILSSASSANFSAPPLPPVASSVQIGIPKISKFLYSKLIDSEKDDGLTSTPCGSPNYASPEILSGNSYDGIKSDMWSLGVILFTMVNGSLPWTAKTTQAMFAQIKKGQYKMPQNLSENCKDLIQSLLQVDVSKRFNIYQALEHPFIKSVKFPKYLNSNGVPIGYEPPNKQFAVENGSVAVPYIDADQCSPHQQLAPRARRKSNRIPKPRRSSERIELKRNDFI